MTAVCLADGAGSVHHAATGARIVTRTTARWVCRHFRWALRVPATEVSDRLLTLLQRRLQQAALADNSVMDEFASTLLLVAVASEGAWLAIHLGDGAILARQQDQLLPLSLPQKGELANETFFVTSAVASDMIRVHRSVDPGAPSSVSGFVLFTDGVEGHLVNRRTGEVAVAGGKLLDWLDQAPEPAVRATLRATLTELFLPLTSDDCSLALLAANDANLLAASPVSNVEADLT